MAIEIIQGKTRNRDDEAMTHSHAEARRNSVYSSHSCRQMAPLRRNMAAPGLGLAICKRLVDLMGGLIGMQSEEGKGSLVWFSIPLEHPGYPA